MHEGGDGVGGVAEDLLVERERPGLVAGLEGSLGLRQVGRARRGKEQEQQEQAAPPQGRASRDRIASRSAGRPTLGSSV